MKKQIILYLFLLLVVTSVFSQEKKAAPDDFCSALNRMMKYSLDNFNSLKGERETTWRGYYTDHYWMAKDSLPGFYENNVRTTITSKDYYYATYYSDADTVAAFNKYNELLDKVKGCIPNLCCDYSQLPEVNMSDMKKYSFWTKSVKATFDKRLGNLCLRVNYVVNMSTKVGEVYITIAQKE